MHTRLTVQLPRGAGTSFKLLPPEHHQPQVRANARRQGAAAAADSAAGDGDATTASGRAAKRREFNRIAAVRFGGCCVGCVADPPMCVGLQATCRQRKLDRERDLRDQLAALHAEHDALVAALARS